MLRFTLRWLVSNLSTLFLAFVLALVVWISSVTAADPDTEFVRTVPIEVVGQDPGLVMMGARPGQARVTLRAPRSIRDRMANTDNALRSWIDLSGLDSGVHTVPVQVQVSEDYRPVRVTAISPENVSVNLERLVSRTFQVKLIVAGEPAIGYQKGSPTRNPSGIIVSGPESRVSLVNEVQARLDISGVRETVQIDVPVIALDVNGEEVLDVNITPNEIQITQPINLLGGYRNVVVKPVTLGQPASGYRLTNITISPPNVLVFSTDPQLVMDLPGFVETIPIDLTGIEDDLDTFVALDLADGISIVGDRTVLVQVNIAALEGSLTMTLPVTPVGLQAIRAAEISPGTVEVILSGPVPVLESLTQADLRVTVDLQGLPLGTHQVAPTLEILPDRLEVEAILPSIVEVVIIIAPTVTPTPRGTLIATPTPQITPSP